MNDIINFENLQVDILIEENENGEQVVLFEIYSTGMALGHVKYNSVGKAYPRIDRIDRDIKNAEIEVCVRAGHKYFTEEQLYDFMLEVKTEKCRPFKKKVTHDILPNIRKGNYVILSDRDKARLKVLNADTESDRVLALGTLEEIVYKEGFDDGYKAGFENIKNERITPLCTITHIANRIKIDGFCSGALNQFLALKGFGTFEKVNKYYKLRPNDKFEEAIIKQGWACWTNQNKTSFKFYEAFADIINEYMDGYKDELLEAKRRYAEIMEKHNDKKEIVLPF